MIKIFFLLIILQVSNCSSSSNDDIYSAAKDFIVSAEKSKEYAYEVFKSTQVNPYVSSELIPFNFSSVETDIIKRNYLQGYSPFGELSEKERSVEKRVIDSLNNMNEYYQEEYQPGKNQSLPLLSEGEQNNFIIFFSEPKGGMLYAELIPYNDEVFKDKKRETAQYGKAVTFLFLFDKDKGIREVFQGEVHYN